MGCKCANPEKEEDEIQKENANNENLNQKEELLDYKNQNDINLNEINNEKKIGEENNVDNKGEKNYQTNGTYDQKAKYANYPEKIVDLINRIREDPVGYADVIEDSMQNIKEEADKNDPNIIRLIYKKKVKVALNNGEPSFREAAEILRSLQPLPPLEFDTDLCVPLPENEEELKNPKFLKEQIKKIRKNHEVDVFFKDLIKVPEVSGLLMIVDDSNKNAGKKRMALLNEDLKYVGVTSKFIGKNFIAYFAFSK